MRTIGLVLLAAVAASGCGHANYASHNEYGMFQEPCGDLNTAEGHTPGSVHVPEQLAAFGTACANIQDAVANAAYARMTNASAQHIAEASTGLAMQQTVAALAEAMRQGATREDVERYCTEHARGNRDLAMTCARAVSLIEQAEASRGGR